MTIISGEIRHKETDLVLTCFKINVDNLNKRLLWKLVRMLELIKQSSKVIRIILRIVQFIRINPVILIKFEVGRHKLLQIINEQLSGFLSDTVYIPELKVENQ